MGLSTGKLMASMSNRSSGYRLKIAAILFLIFHSVDVLSLPSAVKSFEVETPHPFGYVIGDLIKHTVSVTVDKPFRVSESLLPQPGPVKRWLELRAIRVHSSSEVNQRHYTIDLQYQLFKKVEKIDTLFIPAWDLTLQSKDETLQLAIPLWDFSYSPLIPPHIADEDVVIRPAVQPKPLAIGKHIRILVSSIVGLILILLYLAWHHDVLPFFKRNHGPFARAYPQILKLGHSYDDLIGYRDALLLLHRAFDHTLGKTVFADNLQAFFSANPAYRIHEKETQAFFQVSRDVFFADAHPPGEYSFDWLVKLCRRYKKTENQL